MASDRLGAGRAGLEKGAAREKTWKGSQGEGEALRRPRPLPQLHLYRPIEQARGYAP